MIVAAEQHYNFFTNVNDAFVNHKQRDATICRIALTVSLMALEVTFTIIICL